MKKYIRDYYKILRIKKDANQKSIKRAYEIALLRYQPNDNKDHNTKKKMQLIEEAYTVLSDKNKKNKYDKLYEKASKHNKNKIQFNNTIKTSKDTNNNYELLSKGIDIIGKTIKSEPFNKSKMLINNATIGYGVKRGKFGKRNLTQKLVINMLKK